MDCRLHLAEGWPYVAAVLDLFSRHVVGWSISASMTTYPAGDRCFDHGNLAARQAPCTAGPFRVERFCNPKRRHSTLGYLSPTGFETHAQLG
jgi:transposase InsO family protein